MNNIEFKEVLDCLYLHESQLTTGQAEFIDSCKKQFNKTKELSDKQFAVLRDIKKSLLPAGTRVSMNLN
jgi:hypothetical protein